MSTLSVREAQPYEHDAVGALTVAAYRSVLGDRLDPGYASVLAAVDARARTDTVLVVVDAKQLLGAATYVGNPSSPNAEFPAAGDAGIRYLAVRTDAQGRGVGARLVDACVGLARAQAKARVVLHTQVEMVAAQRLYSRLGFTRAPDLDWEPHPGVRLVGFVLPL